MPYLVDGHNVIPKAGLRLDSVEDELELIAALQEFCRRQQKDLEVYFDGAPPGQAGSRKFGRVTAHFVSHRSSADAAIQERLHQLGGDARNWTVVTSDRAVVRAARAAHARVQTAEGFARRLKGPAPGPTGRENAGARVGDGGVAEDEVEHWLTIFKKR